MPAKNFRSRLGILRSRIMYYGKPFNRRRLRKFYSAFVPKGGLCFDIGAHLGNRIAPFLEQLRGSRRRENLYVVLQLIHKAAAILNFRACAAFIWRRGGKTLDRGRKTLKPWDYVPILSEGRRLQGPEPTSR